MGSLSIPDTQLVPISNTILTPSHRYCPGIESSEFITAPSVCHNERSGKRGEDVVSGHDHRSYPDAQGQERSIEGGHRSVDSGELHKRGGVGLQCVFAERGETGSGIGCFEGGAVGAEIQNRGIAEEEGGLEKEEWVEKEGQLQKEGIVEEEDCDEEKDRDEKEELFKEEGVVQKEEWLQKEDIVEEEERIQEIKEIEHWLIGADYVVFENVL